VLVYYLQEFKLLSKYQYEFRPKFSTVYTIEGWLNP